MDGIQRDHRIEDAILIDSTSLPNDGRLPVTAVSSHNGVISNEVQIIYAIRQEMGSPPLFRYIDEEMVKGNTPLHTIAELKANPMYYTFDQEEKSFGLTKQQGEVFPSILVRNPPCKDPHRTRVMQIR